METKELIQEAALDLFSRKGFDSSSVRDIAARFPQRYKTAPPVYQTGGAAELEAP